MSSVFSCDPVTGLVSLQAHPSESGFPASAAQLLELIARSEYADYEIQEGNISTLFNPSNAPASSSLIIAKSVPASMTVRVDEKNMIAEATLTTARGGSVISMEQGEKIIREAGIKRGYSRKSLESILGRQFEDTPGSISTGIVAHGRMPKNGTDARFVRLCLTAQDRILSPQKKEGGKVDMRDLGAIITVNPGSPLMQRIPPTQGEDGFTVFGDPLVATPGKDHQFEITEGSILDPDNPNVLVANSVGVPVALPRGVRVDDVLCYDQVDVTTGHVEFDGSVIVSGDVKDGMVIRATGDITVLGFVESATLESFSEITIVQGAIGRKRADEESFSCHISAQRSVSVGYAQYAKITTEQDLFVDRQTLHCDLSARRLIRIGRGEKPRGKLIGGKVHNALRIEAGEIGAPSGTKTRVYLAQYWHELREKHFQLNDQEKLFKDKLAALSQAKKKAKKITSNYQRQSYLERIESNENMLVAKLHRAQRNKLLVQKKINMLVLTSRLTVNELAHPGVELKIAKDTLNFSRIFPPHRAKLSEGKITQQF